jgi:hypothetical protein
MEEKIVYRGNDTLFYNSKCLCVEYHDVIAMPWFTILSFIKNNEGFNSIFKMNEIADYDLTGLLEWYIYRKHRNILKSIGVNDSSKELSNEEYNTILEKTMEISDDIYRIPTNLKFLSILRLLLSDASMVKQVIIYSEKNEPMIEKTLSQYFSNYGTKVKYMNGKFEDLAKIIPQDSTYVFSDIEKVNDLIKANKLNLSCVLIANGLRYNYLENDASKLKVNLEELSKKYLFKYSFFDNFDFNDAITNGFIPSEIESLNDTVKND